MSSNWNKHTRAYEQNRSTKPSEQSSGSSRQTQKPSSSSQGSQESKSRYSSYNESPRNDVKYNAREAIKPAEREKNDSSAPTSSTSKQSSRYDEVERSLTRTTNCRTSDESSCASRAIRYIGNTAILPAESKYYSATAAEKEEKKGHLGR